MTRFHLILPGMALLLLGCEQPTVKHAEPALALTGRIVDAADILTAEQESMLTKRLEMLEAGGTGPQFVIATTPSLNGQEINFYSIDLARAWAIGSKARNDGVMLLVAPNERKARIEVGTGLEKQLPDEVCSDIIQTQTLPAFKSGDMAGGIEKTADAIIARLQAVQVERKKAA